MARIAGPDALPSRGALVEQGVPGVPGRHEPGQPFAALRVEERKRCSEIILVDAPREHDLVGQDELGAEIPNAV